jgi:hypothetical protein
MEVFGLLNDPYPRVDFVSLEEWIRKVMQDTALADKVKEVVEEDISGHEKTVLTRDLMAERLLGAIQVYKNNAAGAGITS